MSPSQLHVFTARFNPLGWHKPHQNWERFATHMLDSGVHLTCIECAPGNEDFECRNPPMSDPSHAARYLHVGVRAKTRGWCKENLINLGIHRRPEAQYIAWVDADVIFRRPDWAVAALKALQHYDIIQPWQTCLDLGPNGELITAHTSFTTQMFNKKPLAPDSWKTPYWIGDGGKNIYPHSGFAWAMTRQAYDWVGGLFELGGMGSGDHHMALGMAGMAEKSLPPGNNDDYCREVLRWGRRAVHHINHNVGYLPGFVIEHLFHGRKSDRGYITRWGMFIEHGFNPHEDLKRNAYGVFEFATNKPALRHDFDLYLRARNEDVNSL